jgi:hypothetical protein
MAEMPSSGVSTPNLGRVAEWAVRANDVIEIGGAAVDLYKLQGEDNPTKALIGNMQAALKIASTLAPPGVNQYIDVLSAAVGLVPKVAAALVGDTIKNNADALIAYGQWNGLPGTGAPLSKSWFIEKCPELGPLFKQFRMF